MSDMKRMILEEDYEAARDDNKENAAQEKEKKEEQREEIREFGQLSLNHKIHLLSVIGEIEGHECLSSNAKTTKYEHVLPQLAAIEDSTCSYFVVLEIGRAHV